MAESSELSVCSGLGLVCFSTVSEASSGRISPVCSSGNMVSSTSSSGSPRTARQPADLTTTPLMVNISPPADKVTSVISLTQHGKKASSRRAATCSSCDRPSGRFSVMRSAWWSVTLASSTGRRLSGASGRTDAVAVKRGYCRRSIMREGISSKTSSDI